MIEPYQQRKLFSYKNELNFFYSLYLNNKMPNKNLFSGYKGIGKSTFAFHLINLILSVNETDKYDLKKNEINSLSKTFKLINSSTHPNFLYVSLKENKKSIDIDQIRELIKFLKKTSLNLLPKIILIDDLEYLNKNSSNSLLKVLEEPPENVFFFLIHDSQKRIPNTINSRCIKFNLTLNIEEKIKIIDNISKIDYYKINSDLRNIYSTPKFYIDFLEYCKTNDFNINEININLLLEDIFVKKNYKTNLFVKKYFFYLIELFFYKKFVITKDKLKYYKLFNYFTYRMNEIITYNLDLDSFIIEFKSKVLNEK